MEDGNISSTKDDKQASGQFTLPYIDRPAKLTSNGHEELREVPSTTERAHDIRGDATHDAFRKRINPLRIHLGKRPFVDNSLSHHNPNKRKKPFVIKPNSETSAPNSLPRVPKLIPKRTDLNLYHNVSSYSTTAPINAIDSELNKPVPRLIPKSQLSQYKKGKIEKGPQLKEYAQSLGLQPMVKFKCRKCCSMSFKTLAKLKEHQLVCRAQSKEPALVPVAASNTESTAAGPSRVTRKVYLCSACGTYYENWNLFLHMREVHNRHICLFCLGMFSKAEKLASHLTNKHNVLEYNYDSKEDFFKVNNSPLYLMCCLCDEICSEQDDFFNHDCNNVKPKPVPVLISKNAAKSNKLKQNKIINEPVNNGGNLIEGLLDNRETDTLLHRHVEHVNEESKHFETGFTSESISAMKDQAVDSGMELESSNSKTVPSPIPYVPPLKIKNIQTNGDEGLEHTDESNSSFSDNDSPVKDNSRLQVSQLDNKPTLTTPAEKEGGIKLKLSLSSANSPVIINSTVDPSIGQQKIYKPPARSRRPPKRYEKNITSSPVTPSTRTPSIKMTICDKAENPFVKSTIFETNDQQIKSLFNNNLELETKTPEHKSIDNGIKSTIYDNKQEDENVLNRVPKLTVRVPKELLDKDSSSDYSSDSDISDKLTVDENLANEVPVVSPQEPAQPEFDRSEETPDLVNKEEIEQNTVEPIDTDFKVQNDNEDIIPKIEPKTEELLEPESTEETKQEEIVVTDEIPVNELTLDKPLDKYPLKDLLKVFLTYTINTCIYCNHARKIAVNCQQLALHMCAQHRFSATVNSITAEELLPETITAKVRGRACESSTVYLNLETYDSEEKYDIVPNDCLFECFQCYFKTAVHKDLYLHNRKMHQKTIMLCVMCKSNFYSYSELVCHLCPGTYDSDYEVRFRCCICNVDTIPSSFRLMVHLRKMHHTCDVCLEFCQSQGRLSNHVWKHKLHHLCYRCGIAYRNKPDITNHLFWKHGTESVLCKKCLQKKWPHVYHFCTPPAFFACDECSLQFTKAVYLKVHKRLHTNEFPHVCSEEACTEKYVSKKILLKHLEEHRLKLAVENLDQQKPPILENQEEKLKEEIPVIDLVDEKPLEEAGTSVIKDEAGIQTPSKKSKKKKLKDKDALLLDVNLPALNLSESDSSDESDVELPAANQDKSTVKDLDTIIKSPPHDDKSDIDESKNTMSNVLSSPKDEKPSDQKVLEIWDNFKKYQAKVEKQKEKTPPLVPIRKHVCESDHDYCLIPNDMNGEDDSFSLDKKKNKKSSKKQHGDLSLSSSSSSSDSDSSCSCGSNCSCSSSSGSSSSSSSDSDSSDESGTEKKKKQKKPIAARRISNGSNVDIMEMAETPVLVPEKTEPPIAESDLETEESDTDEEFYDENPQKLANKLHAEKRSQLMLLTSVAPSDGGSISGDPSRPPTPIKEEPKKEEVKAEEPPLVKEKSSSSKKKSKKKKKSKSSKKHGPIKINIPKEVIAKSDPEIQPFQVPPAPNKITISLQSNTVQIPVLPAAPAAPPLTPISAAQAAKTAADNKRASKRRRIPNKFYGYSSDEEAPGVSLALKPQQPPKLEWRKEDLPSPTNHKPKKELPSTVVPQQKFFNYIEPIRLKAPIPDPEPPRILMNTESLESSDSDTSEEGALEIYQPSSQNQITPPTYLNSGTSSLPYAFQRPAVRQAREGESVYCYCRCPYDEVSEMIACDAEGCPIEWFHFECVGIMVPPKGKWYCPECRKNLSLSGYR